MQAEFKLNFVIIEGDGRLADVREEFAAYNLKLVQTECVIYLNRLISYRNDGQHVIAVNRKACIVFRISPRIAGYSSIPEVIAVHAVHPPVVSSHPIPP